MFGWVGTTSSYTFDATITNIWIGQWTTVATPMFSPAGGTYSSPQTVTISTFTAGATIYYTTDGSTPGPWSTVYTGPISVTASETINAIAFLAGWTNSSVASAAYTFIGGPYLPLGGGTMTGIITLWTNGLYDAYNNPPQASMVLALDGSGNLAWQFPVYANGSPLFDGNNIYYPMAPISRTQAATSTSALTWLTTVVEPRLAQVRVPFLPRIQTPAAVRGGYSQFMPTATRSRTPAVTSTSVPVFTIAPGLPVQPDRC